MIIDSIKNASLYYGLGARIKAAFHFLENADLLALSPGKYDISGEDVYAIVQDYDSKPLEQGKWEAHRRYIDVQYVARGTERMGYGNIEEFTTSVPYNEEKDVEFFTGSGDMLLAETGAFLIFYPQDMHMPGIAVGTSEPVRKVVVKVRV